MKSFLTSGSILSMYYIIIHLIKRGEKKKDDG